MRFIIATVAVLTLAGCVGPSDGVLTLGEGEFLLEACEPGQSIEVETLTTDTRATCVPWGSELVFPDDARLAIDPDTSSGSTSSSESEYSYGWYDVGVYGIVASRYTTGCADLDIWGSHEAVSKLQEAFGDDLGNC